MHVLPDAHDTSAFAPASIVQCAPLAQSTLALSALTVTSHVLFAAQSTLVAGLDPVTVH